MNRSLHDSVPRFSFVIPAFNAAEWIVAALKSVAAQEFGSWEAIIADDGSSDSTLSLVRKTTEGDIRFRLLESCGNSGSAYAPRLRAARAARGEFIVMLDADDTVPPGYLSALDKALGSSGGDMALSRLVWTDTDGNPTGRSLPGKAAGERLATLPEGKELVEFTLDRWEIGSTGAVERNLYLAAAAEVEAEGAGRIDSDELLTRLLFLKSRKVAPADTDYFYRQTPGSVTRSIGIRWFDRLDTAIAIAGLTAKYFGPESSEREKARLHLFHSLWSALLQYNRHRATLSPERDALFHKFENARHALRHRFGFPSSAPALKRALLAIGTGPALSALSFADSCRRLAGMPRNNPIS